MNIEISILMSFYNEKEEEIIKSISSIISQTFKKWELILVCDNPTRKDFVLYLKKKYFLEKRIKIIENEKNIGLALSMNKALSFSKGEYIARMDSDDICMKKRLEEQLKYMKKNKVDLCCSDFNFIDENDCILTLKARSYENSELRRLLPYENTIHHPTVMIKKNILVECGGYRNFPCAQDYDLWLRLWEKNITMGIIKKPLIQYRIRNNSISQAKKLQQLYTIWYIQKCFNLRLKGKKDIFTLQNYSEYLNRGKVFDIKFREKFEQDRAFKNSLIQYKGKYRYWFLILILLLKSSFYKKYYSKLLLNEIKKRMELKK